MQLVFYTTTGQLMIWDIFSGSLVWSFKNTIEGQGYGALFDAKWSPDGFTIAATDSHGHLILFGIGHNEKFQRVSRYIMDCSLFTTNIHTFNLGPAL